MVEDLLEVEIQKVVGPTAAGAAVLLGNATKSFVVFIGVQEALAIRRELKGERTERPLTHDLMQSVLLGFDLKIRQIVVTRIVENAFCATLILEQKVSEKNGEWIGRRNEVRIDARPSDCLVLALKNRSGIHVTREVFEKVQDVSHLSLGDLSVGDLSLGDPASDEQALHDSALEDLAFGQSVLEVRGPDDLTGGPKAAESDPQGDLTSEGLPVEEQNDVPGDEIADGSQGGRDTSRGEREPEGEDDDDEL